MKKRESQLELITYFRAASAVVAALLLSASVGCNTLEGAGEDVEATGEAVQDVADGE